MAIDYNSRKSGVWMRDLFPEGDWPSEMTPEEFEGYKDKHRALMKRREEDANRSHELKKIEYDSKLKHKATIEYSDALAQEICERISAGELLINICNDYHMPTLKKCNQWLKSNQDFSTLYAQAIQDRLAIFEEEVISIADDMANDFKEITIKNVTKRVVDPEVIARAKLRIDVRFRHLKAGKPGKWGDTSTLITKNDDADDPANLTNEELEKRIADIEAKDRILHIIK